MWAYLRLGTMKERPSVVGPRLPSVRWRWWLAVMGWRASPVAGYGGEEVI
jgi:hypothetical protein